MKILADVTLPHLSIFTPSFQLETYGDAADLKMKLKDNSILLCRSTLTVEPALLKDSAITCVGTASSGVDHVNTSYLEENGITFFSAKGSNAPAVADYVVANLAFLCQQGLISGKKAGIIGLGEVGVRVKSRIATLNFQTICYDPWKANNINSGEFCSFDDLSNCDILFIHANLHQIPPYPSYDLLNANFLKSLDPKTIIINAARGGIVNEESLLQLKHPPIYCTDVYINEPQINPRIVQLATLCTPHIAGHSIEAKQNAVLQLAKQIYDFYQLPCPSFPHAPPTKVKMHSTGWEDSILNLYNPIHETKQLKCAYNLSDTFQHLRANHKFRHNFSNMLIKDDQLLTKLIGIE
jgi:erythronate-4-phosphate dehydrogenase